MAKEKTKIWMMGGTTRIAAMAAAVVAALSIVMMLHYSLLPMVLTRVMW